MNNEIKQWLEKQALWQQSRRALSWPEKIHLAEQIRESIERWRQSPVWNAETDLSHLAEKKKNHEGSTGNGEGTSIGKE